MMEFVDGRDDDLAEIDLTEDEIDAMMAAGEPVEITGPPGLSRLRFELYVSGPRQYRWRPVRDTGDVIATSQAYARKSDARRAVDEITRVSSRAGHGNRTRTASLEGVPSPARTLC